MTAPTVTINQAAGEADPVRFGAVSFDVVFSENVTGFDASDVILSGTAGVTSTNMVVARVDNSHYTVTVWGMQASGAVTADIVTGAATSIATGQASAAESFTDNTVTYIYPTTAASDFYQTNEDTPLTVAASAGVLANDSVGSRNTNSAVLDAGPSHASSFSFNADGSFSYVQQVDYTGLDTFTYHIFDGVADSATTQVMLSVTAVNDPPDIAALAPVTIAEDSTRVFSTANGNAINVSDVDGGNGLETVTLLVSHGTLTLGSTANLQSVINNSSVVVLTGTIANLNLALQGTTYTPAANYNGADQLAVTIDDNDNFNTGTALSLTLKWCRSPSPPSTTRRSTRCRARSARRAASITRLQVCRSAMSMQRR